jgi:hypothetical protein
MKILFSFPKIRFEMIEDKTNIQANEQTKAAKSILECSHEAKTGEGPPIEDTTVVRAV